MVGAPCSCDTTTIQRLPVQPLSLRCRSCTNVLRRARFQRDLELAVLAAHQPHVVSQRQLDLDVALLGGERDQLLERIDGQRRRRRLVT